MSGLFSKNKPLFLLLANQFYCIIKILNKTVFGKDRCLWLWQKIVMKIVLK